VGKTTIISLLEQSGFTVVAEQATQIIREGQILPWVDRDAFQKEVLRRQLEVEAPHLHSDEMVFLDRGLFDGEAYYILDEMEIPFIFCDLPTDRYALAFVVEELSFFDNNGVRFEDLEFTRKITPVIERCYTSRNVPVVRIPAMTPKERLDLVLREIQPLRKPVVRPALPAAARGVNLAWAT